MKNAKINGVKIILYSVKEIGIILDIELFYNIKIKMIQENRSVIYKTFAKLFYYPDEELAAFLFNGVITEFLNYLKINLKNVEKLDEWLDSFENKTQLLEALQVEYTGLYITNYPTIPAPLFKSYYYEKEILGQSTENIMDTYEKFNFHVSEQMQEPADNLAILFEFVHRLSELENTYSDQISFIQNEILSWIEKLAVKINATAKIPFYPLIINIITNYLKNDVTQYEIKLAGAKI